MYFVEQLTTPQKFSDFAPKITLDHAPLLNPELTVSSPPRPHSHLGCINEAKRSEEDGAEATAVLNGEIIEDHSVIALPDDNLSSLVECSITRTASGRGDQMFVQSLLQISELPASGKLFLSVSEHSNVLICLSDALTIWLYTPVRNLRYSTSPSSLYHV